MHYKRASLDDDYSRELGVVVATLSHMRRRAAVRFDLILGFGIYFLE